MSRHGSDDTGIRAHPGGRPAGIVLACALLAGVPTSPAADLQAAIRDGDAAALERALQSTPDNDDAAGLSLHVAVVLEDLEAIRLLYEHGADLELPNRASGAHPLHVAADIGLPPLVNLLVDLGADLEARDNLGRTPLIQAAIAGNGAALEVLLAAGADADAAETGHRITALHLAAFGDRRDIVDSLLAYGADVDAVDDQGETPLFWAIGRGHTQVIAQLVNAGADINHRNRAGVSALGAAAFAYDREVTERLLKLLGAEE